MKMRCIILSAALLCYGTCLAVPATFTLTGTITINTDTTDTGENSKENYNIPAKTEDTKFNQESQDNIHISQVKQEEHAFQDAPKDNIQSQPANPNPFPADRDYGDILRPLQDIAFPAASTENENTHKSAPDHAIQKDTANANNVDHSTPSKTSSDDQGASRPHIVMIVADDLGWNDVSWRDKTMYTPVLTRLASEGIILNQAYVQPVCSPSRAAFMSGYYPYHLGMQHDSLRATQKAHLPDNVTTLPQHLQKLGYKTHMAGKWHLGFCNWRYTPTYRGFDSFVGFYNAIQDYYTHIGHRNGYDFRHNKDVYWKANGTYSAFIFTQYIEQVIADHDPSQPLFVYLPYQSVHGPLQVPQYYIDKYCSHIHNATRRTHCGLVAALDEGVGNVTRALQKKGLYNDTILLFTTDNGGPVHESSNNWPLRGSKATLWEGGTRGTAFLHGPRFFKNSGKSYDGMIHAVDWMPTLVEAAGGPKLTGLDGVSQWTSITQAKVPSARSEFVYNFDELKKNAAIRMGKFKLLEGKPGHPDGWIPPPSMDDDDDSQRQQQQQQRQRHQQQYNYRNVRYGYTGVVDMRIDTDSDILSFVSENIALGEGSSLADLFENQIFNSSEDYADLYENDVRGDMTSEGKDKQYQMYDLEADPYEHHDVKDKYPDVFKQMRARLEEYRKSLVPANFPPHDPDSFPEHFGGAWSPGWC